ncbi:MAG: nucleotide exchange factor GrpE [Thermodesulfobacteriota bacterium]|nr:nucleotide exchange factor GrpE [Thermodesulfobacteriota bacterium]
MIKKTIKTVKHMGHRFDIWVTMPVMEWIIDVLTTRMEKKSEKAFSRSDFKKKALADFKIWLSDTHLDFPSKTDVTPDTCDLFSLLSEFTALRQEIKMQNREQHRTLKRLESYTDTYENNSRLFETKIKDIAQLEKSIWNNCEKKCSFLFFDVRDALVRGHRASLSLSCKRTLFTSRKAEMKNIAKGYEMALRRFDRSLALMDIYPVETDNAQFDPKTMKAVDTRKVHGFSKGQVIETVTCGFFKKKTVLKFAQVIVAE